MAGENLYRAFLIIIKLLLSSGMKKKNHGNVAFCENTSTDCMGKEEAGEMHSPPDGETCTLPEQYFLRVTCFLLCQETVLDYTAG